MAIFGILDPNFGNYIDIQFLYSEYGTLISAIV